jgi:hypothetical protein
MIENWKKLSPRRKTYWATLGCSLLLGFGLGIALFDSAFKIGYSVGQGEPLPNPLLNLSPTMSFAIVVLFNLGLWPITWLWHRTVDEHEEQAVLWGGLIAGYAFIVLGGSWVILSWANVVPEMSLGTAIAIFSFIWSVVWIYKKFR